MLALEQKRAERSCTSFLLVLIRVKESGGQTPGIDAVLADSLFSSVSRCVRGADFVGWYREGRVVGAVLTEGLKMPGADTPGRIGRRVTAMLASELSPLVAIGVEVRVFKPRPIERA